jgi:hypothetical protein
MWRLILSMLATLVTGGSMVPLFHPSPHEK